MKYTTNYVKFKFVSDLGEIGHYEIVDSQSTISRDSSQELYPARSDNK